MLVLSLLPSNVRAQAFGQYLVVIDDSGSMDESDPRRLAVMASMALAGALEDGDQVMVVGMNELAAGTTASFTSPRLLLAGRDTPGVVALGTEQATRLATHHGETPCRAALEAARALLESSGSAGAPQTLLMLTDGACNGGAVESPAAWLEGLRSHREGRFRFVLLMREGRVRPDRHLVEYAQRTGWTGESRVAFDARSLVRAFGEVLAFSRGLRVDEGGHVGIERTFAGARVVRALSIRDRGEGPIAIEQVDRAGAATSIEGGATFRSAEHGWSFRSAALRPSADPFAVRAAAEGVDVLVIPIYGRLAIEAVVAPCGDAPPLPWSSEIAVRAGQPACAWARLVGDAGETIEPGRSFEFGMVTCGAASEGTEMRCSPTPMQPSSAGVFEAQLGVFEPGRYRFSLRATGGALARDVEGERGFVAMRFGVLRVTTASEPERALSELDLGTLPESSQRDLALRYRGAFPADARARPRCEIEASEAAQGCAVCEITSGDSVVLEDDLELHVRVGASPFCAAVSEHEGRPLPITFRVILDPEGDALGAHTLPLRAELQYAAVAPVMASVMGGDHATVELSVPGPVAQSSVVIAVEGGGADLTFDAAPLLARADEAGHIRVPLTLTATDCCSASTREATLILSSEGSELRVPMSITVEDPGFWVCPGKQIALALSALALLLALLWVIHGFTSPARFSRGALIVYASNLEELLALREGDDGWRELRRFKESERGFRRPAAVWLGGPRAPLPSLRRQSADGRIEALGSGSARLVVTGPTVERWNELEARWEELSPGTYPVAGAVRLRRGEDFVMEFRR